MNLLEVLLLGLLFLLGLPPAMAEVPGLDVPAAALSPRQKVEAAEAALVEMRDAVQAARHYLEQAVANKAPEEDVRCLQSCLTPMQALLDISEQSQKVMKQALASADDTHTDLEYRKILVALSKMRGFLSKAMLCARSPVGTSNSLTESNVIVSPTELPEVDMEAGAESPLPELLCGSCF